MKVGGIRANEDLVLRALRLRRRKGRDELEGFGSRERRCDSSAFMQPTGHGLRLLHILSYADIIFRGEGGEGVDMDVDVDGKMDKDGDGDGDGDSDRDDDN